MGQGGYKWQVLVGKTAKDNDHLSFDIGKPHEVWMHAVGAPGSHVVIRQAAEGLRPPRKVVEAAAGICAFYSKLKTQSTVEVQMTTCGKLAKLPGAPAGQVMLRGKFESLRVQPLNPTSLQSKLLK